MKVSRIHIRNFRGIEEREETIPALGAIIQGGNARGKSSFLNAIRTALSAKDIGPDAIRNGASRCEIFVDIDDVSVKRVITAKTSTLTVTRDGMKATAPQTFLRELLGDSAIDPLDLFLAPAKSRRAKILEALPVSVTREQLATWAPVPEGFDVAGHGLDVLERLRKHHYDARTTANAKAKAAHTEAETARKTAADARSFVGPGDADADHVKRAEAALEVQRNALASTVAQQQASAAATKRSVSARTRIAELRETARALGASIVTVLECEVDAIEAARDAANEIRRLEALLSAARASHQAALESARAIREAYALNTRKLAEVDDANRRADELERTLDEASVAPVSDEDLVTAQNAVDEAKNDVARAKHLVEVAALEAKAIAVGAVESQAEQAAAVLDGYVKALAEAPASLLAATSAIPGLALVDDDVMLDGVRLSALSGAEQMRFAVDIAKRLNAKSKLLVVDGLERLDPDPRDAFVRHAVSDGYQLLASLVDRGAPILVAIEADDHAQAAE